MQLRHLLLLQIHLQPIPKRNFASPRMCSALWRFWAHLRGDPWHGKVEWATPSTNPRGSFSKQSRLCRSQSSSYQVVSRTHFTITQLKRYDLPIWALQGHCKVKKKCWSERTWFASRTRHGSIFEGASKYEILHYLRDAKDRLSSTSSASFNTSAEQLNSNVYGVAEGDGSPMGHPSGSEGPLGHMHIVHHPHLHSHVHHHQNNNESISRNQSHR